MTMDNPLTNTASDEGATVVITHRVRKDQHAAYEEWLTEIAPICKAAPGYLDWHIVRPISGLTETYTVVIRFDTKENLQNWLSSSERQRLIDKAKPFFVTGDDFFVSSGLDFWFTPTEAKAKVPVRWKQYLITWSAIYPLATVVPLLINPLLGALGMPKVFPLNMVFDTALVVFLMVYVVMPRYTKLVRKWLFQ